MISTTVVTADGVVDAGGAWIDAVNRRLGIDSRYIGGNKGSHVVVRSPALHAALEGRMIYFGSADGRVNRLHPVMGNVLIGSTDIPVDDPDRAVCTREEIDCLLGIVAAVFPSIPLPRSVVAYTCCGVRPLPRSEGVEPGLVSRDHTIAQDRLPGPDMPVLALIGGKWTTFRGFAEEAADRILGRLDAAVVDEVAGLLASGLGWSADRTADEAARCPSRLPAPPSAEAA